MRQSLWCVIMQTDRRKKDGHSCLCSFSLCVLLATTIACFAQSSPSVASAEALIANGHFDEALQQLDTISTHATPGRVEYLRGMAHYLNGEMIKAAASFAKAADQDPENLDAMQMEGVSLFRTGKPGEAVPLLEKAHKSVPNANIDPNYVLGLCYIQTSRYDDARTAFSRQYGFAPNSAPGYLLEARMLLRQDYLPVAEEAARKALALNPTLPRAHFLLGESALAQAKISEAIAQFKQETVLNPLDGAAYDRLGDAYIRQGDFSRAQEALDRALLLEPNVSVPYLLLGKALLKQQNPFMAKMYLERALQMDPRNYMAHFLLGQAYRSLGQVDDAKRESQTAAKIQTASAPKLE
jgi:tetratricopeptide (TPR) repeat protein